MTTVIQAIKAQVKNGRVAMAMAMDAQLEGGSFGAGPFGVGDKGTSFGPFQIHLPAHPGVTAAEASDPMWAVRYMEPDYAKAAAAIPNSLWINDPVQAAEETAYAAERPQVSYFQSDGTARVTQAFNRGRAALAGKSFVGGAPGAGSTGSTPTGGTGSSTGGGGVTDTGFLSSEIGTVGKYLLEGVLVLGGLGLIAVGLFRASGSTPSSAAEKLTPLAEAAAA